MKKINYKKGLWLNSQKDVRPQYYSISEKDEHSYIEVKNSSVGRFMYDNGMAQTRAVRFAEAIEMIFSALCHCDSRNLQIVLKDYPELLTIAQFYSDLNGTPNKNFREDKATAEFFNPTEEE
jgi:hypothetical protein